MGVGGTLTPTEALVLRRIDEPQRQSASSEGPIKGAREKLPRMLER